MQCAAGSNSSSLGLTKASDCPPCLKSYYCPHNGTVVATRLCLPGYYCPSGTADPTFDPKLLCPTGSHCPLGSSDPVPCLAGSYQDEMGSSECKVCPAGSVCGLKSSVPEPCPMGSYCLAGTRFGGQHLCPSGTFSNQVNLTKQSDCKSCLPGMYCESAGLTAPTGSCVAGYFCGGGSSTSHPFGNVNISTTSHNNSSQSSHSLILSYMGDTCVRPNNNATLNDICPPGE